VRGDTLNPGLLGMSTTVSEDVVRRAMIRMPEDKGLAWLGGELRECVQPVLSRMCCNFVVEPKVGVDDRQFSSSPRTARE
jgi:hypothetical protein